LSYTPKPVDAKSRKCIPPSQRVILGLFKGIIYVLVIVVHILENDGDNAFWSDTEVERLNRIAQASQPFR